MTFPSLGEKLVYLQWFQSRWLAPKDVFCVGVLLNHLNLGIVTSALNHV